MGGGPSREEREQQEALRRAQEEANRRAAAAEERANQFITIASQPDPLEERLRARDMRWLDFEEGKSGPIDISKAPDMGIALGNFNAAKNRQNSEKMGLGLLRMGAQGSNPELANLLRQQSQDRREQEAAGELQNAVAMKSAEVNQSLLPLADFAQGRRMGLASLQTGRESGAFGNAANSTQAYSSFLARPRQPSFWKQLLLAGVSGGSQMASSYLGR